MRFIDATYATILVPAFSVIPAFFASAPERRIGIAFMNSNTLLWIGGAWLYVAIPALGPTYRFPEVWLPLASVLPRTQNPAAPAHDELSRRADLAAGTAAADQRLFRRRGVSELHVGFQVLSFLWMRRLTRWGATFFGLLALFTFIGSIVTGWHYLVDGIGGAPLAWGCYAAAQRVPAIRA